MTYEQALEYLNTHNGKKPIGLYREKELLRRLGNPDRALKFVHVVGTNGKGSTCAMLAEILMSAGYKTGLFPSPYIEDFRERIQINNVMIPKEKLAEITERVREEAERMEDVPTHFELITAIGMLYFKEEGVEVVMLEAGLGGEFDSTNAIDSPEAAVICNIGLDHTEFLGDTVEKIARTKCGIIKPGCAVVTYDNVPSVIDVIEEVSAANGNKVYKASDLIIEEGEKSLEGQRFKVNGREYVLSLLGRHQLENTRTVLKTVEALRDRGFDISDDAVSEGLRNVKWPARFEVLKKEPVFILDGGHNPQCAEALKASIEEYLPGRKVTFIIGMLKDKDYFDVVKIIAPVSEEFFVVTPDYAGRALGAKEFSDVISGLGYRARAFDSLDEALEKALSTRNFTVAFGSLYLAGEVRSKMASKNFLKKS
ncbi:MAG: folylpolyglutamate synthase/dihydrofolate synthase family protein [Eubacteriales bacterium]|nr:folylpolyglutamate synthase/dihydrofolate synthase family protein [Eubacteriales bacterium]